MKDMKVKIKSACLHGPFFMEGVNYGEKIGTHDAKMAKPLELFMNESGTGLIAVNKTKGCAAVIPITSVASWVPIDFNDIGLELTFNAKPVQKVVIEQPTAPVRAQHFNPMVNPAQVENPTQPKIGRTKQ